MNRLALFDCDGTLVDSQAAICRAMDECFTCHSLTPPDRSATRRVVGLSLPQAMQALLPNAETGMHHSLAESYKQAFQRHRAEGLVDEPLFDGLVHALDRLRASGWLLGVATGKSDRGLRLCLERHEIHGRFITLQTADRHPSKPHPAMLHAAMAEAGAAPGSTVMIGDTSFDMAMAVSAGAHALGVGWGYHDAEELRAAGAADVVDSAPALLAWMERFWMADPETLARNRFLSISALRLIGALMVPLGLVIAAGRLDAVPRAAGVVIVIVGALSFSLVPLWLARRWRTPK